MEVVLLEYLDKSYNFTNLNFYDVITLELYKTLVKKTNNSNKTASKKGVDG